MANYDFPELNIQGGIRCGERAQGHESGLEY